MLNVAMPEPRLESPRIVAGVRQGETASTAARAFAKRVRRERLYAVSVSTSVSASSNSRYGSSFTTSLPFSVCFQKQRVRQLDLKEANGLLEETVLGPESQMPEPVSKIVAARF